VPPRGTDRASLERPDGVEIHWEAWGTGPPVVVIHHLLWSYRQVYADLIDDLARDHQVVQYDPRGCGLSSRRGPYDAETDTEDLLAVIEAAAGAAVVVAVGYAFNFTARAATRRPDLIPHVLAIGPAAAAMLPRSELKDSETLVGSDSVAEMVLTMMSTDSRSALRTLIGASNPGLDEALLRERVDRVAAYISPEAGLHRARAWLEDNVSEQGRDLGDRLWIQYGREEPLFESALGARVAALFPKAHLEEVPGGPISRPDIAAGTVRRITATATARRGNGNRA
jgi:pimeloyl-ACP methyl ester carboxylesterase